MSIKALYPSTFPITQVDFSNKSFLPPEVEFSRGSSATYIGSDGLIKTALPGEPRFTHDPVSGEGLGLLVEETGTNLLTYSEDFSFWQRINAAYLANATTAPNGTITADKIIPNNGATSADVRRQTFINVNGTFSFYAKPDGFNFIGGQVHTRSPEAYLTFRIDLLTGASSASNNNISISTQKIRDGWWRISIVGNFGGNGFIIAPRNDYVLGFTSISGADGIKGMYLWGTQLEASPYPSSYIPTFGSAVTRAADTFSIPVQNLKSSRIVFAPSSSTHSLTSPTLTFSDSSSPTPPYSFLCTLNIS